MTAISTITSNKELTRFSRFLVVGALGTALDFSILTLLKMADLHTMIANSISFTAGLIHNFTLNRLWTFGDTAEMNWRKLLIRYALVSLVGLTINNLIVIALETPLGLLLGQPEFGYLPAKIVATGVTVFWNYFVNRKWTFKNH